MLDTLLLPLLAFVALFIFVSFLKKSQSATQSGDTPELGYRKKGPLFTPAERSFYGVLLPAVDQEKYQVFGKVRVADLLEPQPSRNRSQWQKAFNAISAKHFDFVLCKTDDLTPVAVIELDDKSHNQKHRQKRDELLKKICKQTGLHMLQVFAKLAYKNEKLKMMLAKVLQMASVKKEMNIEFTGLVRVTI